MKTLRKVCLVTVALLVGAGTVSAADAARPEKPTKADIVGSADLQKLIDQFNSRRDALLADREAWINQLKNATEEQRKVLLEQMKAKEKDIVEAQRALGRQIRDEMRKLRQSTPGGRP